MKALDLLTTKSTRTNSKSKNQRHQTPQAKKMEVIISVNTDKMLSKLLWTVKYISKHNPSVALIQDVPNISIKRLKETTNNLLQNYEIITTELENNNNNMTLVNMFTAKIDKVIKLNNKSAITLGCTITYINTTTEQTANLINIYIRPRTTSFELNDSLRKIKEYISESKAGMSHSIICGDLNSTSPNWAPINKVNNNKSQGDKSYYNLCKNRGRQIDRFIKDAKLTCLTPHLIGPTLRNSNNNHVDVALIGSKMLRRHRDTKLHSIKKGYGHKIINISLKDIHKDNKHKTRYIDTYKIKEIKKSHYLELNIRAPPLYNNWFNLSRKEIRDRMNKLTELLYHSLLNTQNKIKRTRTINIKNKRLIQSTWTRKTMNKLIKRESKLKELRTKINKDNKTTLKNQINKLCKKANDARNKTLKNVQKDNIDQRMKNDVWKAYEWIKRSDSRNNNQDTENNTPIEELADKHFPFLRRESIKKHKNNLKNLNNNQRCDITSSEIEHALNEIRNKTYTDPSGLKYRVFLASLEHTKTVIQAICLMSFNIAQVPKICHNTLGQLIPKKQVGAFRIVHISAILSGILEIICLHKLESALEDEEAINRHQFGFTALRGRHDLIARALELIIKDKANKGSKATSTILSLDVEGAFDNVSQDELINKLDTDLGHYPFKTWLTDYILNRKIQVKLGTKISKTREVCKGVPQGSALGPVLWNYVINKIDQDIRKTGIIELLAYADDILIIYNGNREEFLQNTLNEVMNKLQSLKLNIRPEKCSIMTVKITNRKISRHKTLTVKIHGKEVQATDKMRILGVNITKNLKMEQDNKEHQKAIDDNIHRLYKINQLDIINSNQQWLVLIDSLLLSRIVQNNIPILAIDALSRTNAEKILTTAIKTIFGWADNISIKLMRLILNILPVEIMIKKAIQQRIHTEHNRSYTLLSKTLKTNVSKIKDLPIKDRQQLDSLIINKKRYYDPIHILPKTSTKDYKYITEKLGPVWMFNDKKDKRGVHIYEVLQDNILQTFRIKHGHYPTNYFNRLAAIWKITTDNGIKNRKIILNREDALVQTLHNTLNRDWRIIELRQHIMENNWSLIETDQHTLNKINLKINKITTEQQTQNNIETITCNNTITHEPDLRDYRDRNDLNKRINTEIRIAMDLNHTTITKLICKKAKVWNQVRASWLSNYTLIMLTGLIQDENKQLVRGNLAIGTTPSECEEETCKISSHDNQMNIHTTTHRAFICPRYNEERKEIEELINRTTGSDGITNKNLEKTLGHSRYGQTLLRLLTNIAIPHRDV